MVIGGERQTINALFSDLDGSTALIEESSD